MLVNSIDDIGDNAKLKLCGTDGETVWLNVTPKTLKAIKRAIDAQSVIETIKANDKLLKGMAI